MKHLFYVHSHITDLVAKQVVAQLALAPADCIFLLARNHQSDFPNQLKFPYSHYPVDSFKVSLMFWKNRKKVEGLDHWLEEITQKNEFTYYTPQSGMNFFYLIANHPLCKKYAYIEEGLCSYLPEEQLKNPKKEFWLRDLLYDLNFKNRAPSVKHFYDLKHPKYLGCYGISQHSFPGLPKTQHFKLPFVSNKDLENIEHVLVLGQYVEYGEMTIDSLLHVLELLLEKLIEKNIDILHIKLHPAQQDKISVLPIKELCNRYSSRLKIQWMSKEIVLENIAFSTDANFYIISSSVGIYASIAGRKVFSLAKEVAKLEPDFQKKIDDFPPFFKDSLVYLS